MSTFAKFGEPLYDRVSGTAGTWEEFAGESLRQQKEEEQR